MRGGLDDSAAQNRLKMVAIDHSNTHHYHQTPPCMCAVVQAAQLLREAITPLCTARYLHGRGGRFFSILSLTTRQTTDTAAIPVPPKDAHSHKCGRLPIKARVTSGALNSERIISLRLGAGAINSSLGQPVAS